MKNLFTLLLFLFTVSVANAQLAVEYALQTQRVEKSASIDNVKTSLVILPQERVSAVFYHSLSDSRNHSIGYEMRLNAFYDKPVTPFVSIGYGVLFDSNSAFNELPYGAGIKLSSGGYGLNIGVTRTVAYNHNADVKDTATMLSVALSLTLR